MAVGGKSMAMRGKKSMENIRSELLMTWQCPVGILWIECAIAAIVLVPFAVYASVASTTHIMAIEVDPLLGTKSVSIVIMRFKDMLFCEKDPK